MLGAVIGGYPGVPYSTVINRHVFEALAMNARIALRVQVLYGRDQHHITEAEFKAVARTAGGHRIRRPGDGHPVDEGSPVSTNVAILDYGSGNLRSAQRALERTGADVTVTSDMQEALNADGLVVPGVGAYEACMTGLREVRGERIIGRRLAGGRPVLGICVGMQILFERGVEFGWRPTGAPNGPAPSPSSRRRCCRTWAGTRCRPQSSVLFDGLDADTRFYFVHSYAAQSWEMDNDGTALAAPS